MGVAINKGIKNVKQQNIKYDSFECMKISITHSNIKMSINLIYRPPQTNIVQYLDEYQSFITNMEMSAEPCIYIGDFNIAMNNEHDYKTVAFKSLLEPHNLENIIQSATGEPRSCFNSAVVFGS